MTRVLLPDARTAAGRTLVDRLLTATTTVGLRLLVGRDRGRILKGDGRALGLGIRKGDGRALGLGIRGVILFKEAAVSPIDSTGGQLHMVVSMSTDGDDDTFLVPSFRDGILDPNTGTDGKGTERLSMGVVPLLTLLSLPLSDAVATFHHVDPLSGECGVMSRDDGSYGMAKKHFGGR